MSDMIRRVAKAIRDVNANTRGMSFTELSEAMARAAIEAMREPPAEYMEMYPPSWPKDFDEWYPPNNVRAAIWRDIIGFALSQDTHSPPTPAATPTDSANPPPVESVGPNSEAQS